MRIHEEPGMWIVRRVGEPDTGHDWPSLTGTRNISCSILVLCTAIWMSVVERAGLLFSSLCADPWGYASFETWNPIESSDQP